MEGNPYAEGVRELYSQLLQRLWKQRTANQSILAIGHLQATGAEIAEKDYSCLLYTSPNLPIEEGGAATIRTSGYIFLSLIHISYFIAIRFS